MLLHKYSITICSIRKTKVTKMIQKIPLLHRNMSKVCFSKNVSILLKPFTDAFKVRLNSISIQKNILNMSICHKKMNGINIDKMRL